jgi:putative acetyltransferase
MIRPYQPEDLDAVVEVFLEAIRQTASKDYAPVQVEAWAQVDRDLWRHRRLERPTWVVEMDGKAVAFTDLEPDGHIDMLYVHPGYGRSGLAKRLLDAVEERAHQLGITRIYSEACATARSNFERAGFVVVAPETVSRNGQEFIRFRMQKIIGA